MAPATEYEGTTANISPEVDFCSKLFNAAKALISDNVPLPYPKSKTYNNLAEYFSHTFGKKGCSDEPNGISKNSADEPHTPERNYAWYFATLGLEYTSDAEERMLLKLKYKKNIKSKNKENINKQSVCTEKPYENGKKASNTIEPLRSQKILKVKSDIIPYKRKNSSRDSINEMIKNVKLEDKEIVQVEVKQAKEDTAVCNESEITSAFIEENDVTSQILSSCDLPRGLKVEVCDKESKAVFAKNKLVDKCDIGSSALEGIAEGASSRSSSGVMQNYLSSELDYSNSERANSNNAHKNVIEFQSRSSEVCDTKCFDKQLNFDSELNIQRGNLLDESEENEAKGNIKCIEVHVTSSTCSDDHQMDANKTVVQAKDVKVEFQNEAKSSEEDVKATENISHSSEAIKEKTLLEMARKARARVHSTKANIVEIREQVYEALSVLEKKSKKQVYTRNPKTICKENIAVKPKDNETRSKKNDDNLIREKVYKDALRVLSISEKSNQENSDYFDYALDNIAQRKNFSPEFKEFSLKASKNFQTPKKSEKVFSAERSGNKSILKSRENICNSNNQPVMVSIDRNLITVSSDECTNKPLTSSEFSFSTPTRKLNYRIPRRKRNLTENIENAKMRRLVYER